MVSRETSEEEKLGARHRRLQFLVCQALQLLGRIALVERRGAVRMLAQEKDVLLDGLFEVLEALNDENFEEDLYGPR